MADDLRCMSRRTLLRATIAAAGSLALAGCSGLGGETGSSVEGDADPRSGTLAIGCLKPVCLDPFDAVDEAGAQISYQLFDPLMRYDCRYDVLACLAAESYTVSEDQCEFTFTLREAVFHNGETVRSLDFKRAWERIVSPNSAASALHGTSSVAYLLSLVEGYEELRCGSATRLSGVSCPDDRTLVVRLSSPYADFPYIVSHHCLAPVPAAAEEDAAAFATTPIGNGPFAMTGPWDADADRIDLARFADYTGTVIAIEQVDFHVYDSIKDSYRAFEAGDLTVSSCPIESADARAASWKSSDDERLEITEERRSVLGVSPTVSFLVCNTAVAPFDDVRFRRAVSLAIDYEGIAKQVFRDVRMPADGIVPPVVPGYREGAWPYATHDPNTAKELLDELYPMGSDRKRDVSLTLTCSMDSGHKNALEEIVDDLDAVGIACEIEEIRLEDLVVRYRSGSFQMGRFDWTCDFPSMDNILYPLFHSASIGGNNFSRYSNGQVDTLITDARSTANAGERIRMLQDADAIVGDECPVLPYVFGSYCCSGSHRIKDLYVAPGCLANLGQAELAE